MDVEMIGTLPALKAFLSGLPKPDKTPGLYIDLEGNNLSRDGTLSSVTILVEPRHTVHLVDVTTLGKDAFTSPDANGKTLSRSWNPKRSSNLFGVRVGGIEDVQLMEIASRDQHIPKHYLKGLAKCVETDTQMTDADKKAWKATKDQGHRLFDPALGGSYAVFDARPLTKEIQTYCAQDVLHLPALRENYKGKISNDWWNEVKQETVARIALSQSASFNGKGQHMAEGPVSWQRKRSRYSYHDDSDVEAANEDLLDSVFNDDH